MKYILNPITNFFILGLVFLCALLSTIVYFLYFLKLPYNKGFYIIDCWKDLDIQDKRAFLEKNILFDIIIENIKR